MGMFFTIIFAIVFTNCLGVKRNFLLIIVDDLRPSLGCYEDQNAWTPNVDRLAREGVLFNQAYAQQALCAPSRNSFLTSRRPETLRLYDFYSYWRRAAGNFTTLPQHLKENGYVTKSIGKVFHPGVSSNNNDDSPYSWTEKPFHPLTNKFKDCKVCRKNEHQPPARNLVCPVDVSKMPNQTLPDIEILKEAKRFLKNRNNSAPFFLAVGFEKPHIPLKYPRKYLKHHPLSKFDVPHPYEWPKTVSDVAYNPWIDLRKREDVAALDLKFPWKKIPVEFARRIIQSYYAAVSYIDDLIGKLINQLEISSIRDDTVIILTSDHGWSLGEHSLWAKYSNFDVALRVPLIISTLPRRKSKKIQYTQNLPQPEHSSRMKPLLNARRNHFYDNGNFEYAELVKKGRKERKIRNEIVELVDLFPTIAELAGFPVSVCKRKTNEQKIESLDRNRNLEITCTEGISLVPLLNASDSRVSWKKAAYSQYPRPSVEPSSKPSSDEPRLHDVRLMGHTIKTAKYRYTAWLPFDWRVNIANWSKVIAEELYDHSTDGCECNNVVDDVDYKSARNNLWKLLRDGWRSVLPRNFAV